MKKYNPCLKTMVDNWRERLNKDVDTSNYSDEELFRNIDYWSMLNDNSEQELAIREDIQAGVKR